MLRQDLTYYIQFFAEFNFSEFVHQNLFFIIFCSARSGSALREASWILISLEDTDPKGQKLSKRTRNTEGILATTESLLPV